MVLHPDLALELANQHLEDLRADARRSRIRRTLRLRARQLRLAERVRLATARHASVQSA